MKKIHNLQLKEYHTEKNDLFLKKRLCWFSTKLFVVNAQIFVYNCEFGKRKKKSQTLSHFENASTIQKRTIF